MQSFIISPRANFTREQIAAACRTHGVGLLVPAGIDGAKVLWALSGCESSYGANCQPRHESAYCTGTFSRNAQVIALTQRFGHEAHCSFGPWQLMLCNAFRVAIPADFDNLDVAAVDTVAFINANIFRRECAKTLGEIADAYNSGDWRDRFEPLKYMADFTSNYRNVAMLGA